MTDPSKRLNPAWQRHVRSLNAWNQNVRRWTLWLFPRLLPRSDYIFVSAFPKSGSTLLNNVLIRLTGHFPHPLCDHHLHEQNLVLSRLVDSWGFRSIATQHTLATPLNVERLKQFGIRPVILVRNIYDAAISLRDHTEREALHTATFNPPPGFADLSPEEKLDAIIDLALPWHLQFVASWQQADIDHVTVTYEQLTQSPVETITEILTHLGREGSPEEIEKAWNAAANKGDTRFNVGQSGRGEAAFTSAQIARLKKLASYYPETDFSPIGL